MLSILIPTYNYDISILVRKLLEQLKNEKIIYEIVVLDDASTDFSSVEKNKTIQEIGHCTYILSEKNAGRTATRNALAQHAQYDRLLFMDADVLPKNNDFITKFEIETNKADVIFGGISYECDKPEKEKMLRWKYGKAREAKPVSVRKKTPHLSIISQCFLIKKEVFLQANNFLNNAYGVDVLFCQNLEKLKTTVLHIDNPIIHLGLESNISFIEKTKKGLETLVMFESEGKIPNDYRPVQKAYLSLKNNHFIKIFCWIMKMSNARIEKNLKSGKPSLFLFDLYKLYYYVQLKNGSNPKF